jgi:hypothetical protein
MVKLCLELGWGLASERARVPDVDEIAVSSGQSSR